MWIKGLLALMFSTSSTVCVCLSWTTMFLRSPVLISLCWQLQSSQLQGKTSDRNMGCCIWSDRLLTEHLLKQQSMMFEGWRLSAKRACDILGENELYITLEEPFVMIRKTHVMCNQYNNFSLKKRKVSTKYCIRVKNLQKNNNKYNKPTKIKHEYYF